MGFTGDNYTTCLSSCVSLAINVYNNIMCMVINWTTIVWERFACKTFLSVVWLDAN